MFFSSFHTNYMIGFNLQARTLIWLKFGTPIGCTQANSGMNFGDNTAKFTELQMFICIYKDQTLDTPTG